MKQILFFRDPNSHLETLILDPTETLTLAELKLSLFPTTNPSSFFFTFNGKPLPDSTPLPNPQIPHFSTLFSSPRLLAGGGDGGATGAESRDCYLSMYSDKKPDKIDPHEKRLSKWLNCSLSNEPLSPPCVIDRLGNVFNKETLVECLVRRNLPKEFRYIKGLKDMIDIRLELVRGSESRFQCPVTGLEFNGKYRFFALRNCGHVLSAKALKEVKSSNCLVCFEGFEEGDKVALNGSEEEVRVLRERMEEEEGKKKVVKKGKKHGIVVDDNKVDGNGKIEVAGNVRSTKRFKAVDVAPANANRDVYASIFTSSKKSDLRETFSCRSLPLGRN